MLHLTTVARDGLTMTRQKFGPTEGAKNSSSNSFHRKPQKVTLKLDLKGRDGGRDSSQEVFELPDPGAPICKSRCAHRKGFSNEIRADFF